MKKKFLSLLAGGLLLSTWLIPSPGAAAEVPAAELVQDGQLIDLGHARYRGLFKELRLEHGFSEEELDRYFSGLTIKRRVLELMDRQWEAKPYHEYAPNFITGPIVAMGREKLKEHAVVLEEIEQKLGVEREVVVAIWGIETKFGQVEGIFNVFQTLNTLFDAYPRRRDFFRNQLLEFLLMARENGIDPLEVKGSYAGAFGQTQFIPSSYRAYAVDFDGDGRRNVMRSVPDVLASIANYLRQFGWVYGEPVYWELGGELKDARLQAAYEQGRKGRVSWQLASEVQKAAMPPARSEVSIVGLELADGGMRFVAGYPNFQAITAWNHSNRYAMAVAELAEKFRE